MKGGNTYIKKVRMLYSESTTGLEEEIEYFKVENNIKPYHIDIIKHLNGHCTALVWYRVKTNKRECYP